MLAASRTGGQTMSTFAKRYDEVLVPVIFQPWAREMLDRVKPADGQHVLDLACGTGAVTREVARSCRPGSLTGADMTAEMLDVARKRAEQTGIVARWVEADALNLPFADNAFDLAYCQQALQFFPDRVATLRELRRVLKDGSRVAFCVTTDLSENPLLRAQSAALEKFAGKDAGSAVRAICCLYDPVEIRANFENAGFDAITVDKVSLTLFHPDGRAYAEAAMGGMHTGDKLGGLSDVQRDACFDFFLAQMGACFDGKAIRFPHVSHVVTARA